MQKSTTPHRRHEVEIDDCVKGGRVKPSRVQTVPPHPFEQQVDMYITCKAHVRLGWRAMEARVWMTGVTLFARFCATRPSSRRGGVGASDTQGETHR
jgi:hypothetical protein